MEKNQEIKLKAEEFRRVETGYATETWAWEGRVFAWAIWAMCVSYDLEQQGADPDDALLAKIKAANCMRPLCVSSDMTEYEAKFGKFKPS